MFKLTNTQDSRVTCGKVNKVIIEPEHFDTPNTTIEFHQGYMDGDRFVSLGADSICFTGEDYVESVTATDYEAFLVSKIGG